MPAPKTERVSPRRQFFDAKRLLGWPGAMIEEEWQASEAAKLKTAREKIAAKKQKKAKRPTKRKKP